MTDDRTKDEGPQPGSRPVRESTEEILAETDKNILKILRVFIPLLRENWKHLSAGTRDALLREFSRAPSAGDDDPYGG